MFLEMTAVVGRPLMTRTTHLRRVHAPVCAAFEWAVQRGSSSGDCLSSRYISVNRLHTCKPEALAAAEGNAWAVQSA